MRADVDVFSVVPKILKMYSSEPKRLNLCSVKNDFDTCTVNSQCKLYCTYIFNREQF